MPLIDKRLARLLMLVAQEYEARAQADLTQVQDDMEVMAGVVLNDAQALAMKGALELEATLKAAVTLVNDAMDACSESMQPPKEKT